MTCNEPLSSNPTFCRSCGASIPHRNGEGRCEKCVEHDPAWARREIARLTAELKAASDEAAVFRGSTFMGAAKIRTLEAERDRLEELTNRQSVHETELAHENGKLRAALEEAQAGEAAALRALAESQGLRLPDETTVCICPKESLRRGWHENCPIHGRDSENGEGSR